VLAIIPILIVAFWLAANLTSETETPNQDIAQSIDNLTEEAQQNIPAEENQTEEESKQTSKTGCGDGVCSADERCDEDSHLTVCVEDCGRTCPAYLIMHKTAEGTDNDYFAMSCGGDFCEQTDVNKFRVNGNTRVKTIITNIGEESSSPVRSSFLCWSGESSVFSDKDKINGVVFEDYFNDGENEVKFINPIQSVNNSAVYYLAFDTSNMTEGFIATCKITIHSVDFEKRQTFEISFVKK